MRTRTCKPGFYQDSELHQHASPAAVEFYRGSWGLMDRNGVLPDDPLWIKAMLYPYSETVTSARVSEWISELLRPRAEGSKPGYFVRFKHEGKSYIYCKALTKHQYFHHKENPQFPDPETPFTTKFLEQVRVNFEGKPFPATSRVETRDVWWQRQRGEYGGGEGSVGFIPTVETPEQVEVDASGAYFVKRVMEPGPDLDKTEALPSVDSKESESSRSVLTVPTVPTVLTSNCAAKTDGPEPEPEKAQALGQTLDSGETEEGTRPVPVETEAPLTFHDFEPLYQSYPRKLGNDKAAGIRSITSQVRNRRALAAFSAALKAYSAHLKRTSQECKAWENWIGNKRDGYPWRNWVPDEFTKAQATESPRIAPVAERNEPPAVPLSDEEKLEQKRMRANIIAGRHHEAEGWPPGYDPVSGKRVSFDIEPNPPGFATVVKAAPGVKK